MEITYRKQTIKVNKYVGGTTPFFVQAVGDLDGIQFYFGSYEQGKCDVCIEGSTLVRCGFGKVGGKTIKENVEWLQNDLLNKIQQSGRSMPEVIDKYLRTHKWGLKDNYIYLWQTSLLIGL